MNYTTEIVKSPWANLVFPDVPGTVWIDPRFGYLGKFRDRMLNNVKKLIKEEKSRRCKSRDTLSLSLERGVLPAFDYIYGMNSVFFTSKQSNSNLNLST